ncbi:SDR family oxidoreductase [Streptomyces sp. GD-15H]|uniref:SDR family NAD(P)-dependent oxidoreductase n=1 Tax=Streptomyces sp. GD-15H TaxID=3129112 RepID=UPI00324319CE
MSLAEKSPLNALGVNLAGQRVAVIGVGGIGLEVGRICATLGARLVMVDVAAQDDAVTSSLAHPDRHTWVVADITDATDQAGIVDRCRDVDAVVITSAICPDETVVDIDDDEAWAASFERIMAVNTAGPMRICQRLLPHMQARGSGRIVILSSLASRNGGLLSGPHYSASKGALNSFVRWMATRGAPKGVSVNGIVPGVTETPILGGRTVDASRIPTGRIAKPIEVARAAVFLASPAASYIHGVTLDVNGGVWMG